MRDQMPTGGIAGTQSAAGADRPLRLRARTRMVWFGDTLLLQLGRREFRLPGFGETHLAELHELRAGCDRTRVESSPWLRALSDRGFLEEVPPSSDDPDHARFDRLLNYLSEFETPEADRFQLLDRLRTGRIVLVGLGGLASWVVYNLLCCGIGRFTLIDGDVVEASNLNRSILYTEDDIGRPKVLAARDRMLAFAPRTEITPVQRLIGSPEDLTAFVADADLVIGMADQPPWLIKEWIAAAAGAAGTPCLQASGSRVGPFTTGPGTACSVCDWTHQMERQPRYGELFSRQTRLPRGDSGAVSALGAVTAGAVTLDVVRHLLGLEPRTRDRIWQAHGDMSAGYVECPPHERCGVCGTTPETDRVDTPTGILALR